MIKLVTLAEDPRLSVLLPELAETCKAPRSGLLPEESVRV